VPKKKRARTERRDLASRLEKLAEARRKLIALEPGGTPERPLEVSSAAIVEPRAESFACPDCNGPMRAREHVALGSAIARVRAVTLRCRSCSASLRVYLRIVMPLLQ
jgi:uncharacterized protein with PIN domain